jgi:hypothetical protein
MPSAKTRGAGRPSTRMSPKRLERLNKARKAYNMRLSGAIYEQIATELQCSISQAFGLVKFYAEQNPDPDVIDKRKLEENRLEAISLRLFETFYKPIPLFREVVKDDMTPEQRVRVAESIAKMEIARNSAADLLIKTSKRRSDLLGLDRKTTGIIVEDGGNLSLNQVNIDALAPDMREVYKISSGHVSEDEARAAYAAVWSLRYGEPAPWIAPTDAPQLPIGYNASSDGQQTSTIDGSFTEVAE